MGRESREQSIFQASSPAVGFGQVLEMQVQDPGRHRPAEHQEAAELGGRGVGHEQAVIADREWWPGRPLVLPQTNEPASPNFLRDHAHRDWALAIARDVFEVDCPDLAEGKVHRTSPSSTLMTRWSGEVIVFSAKANRISSLNGLSVHTGSGCLAFACNQV